MIGYSIAAWPMIQLGTFQFNINTAAYQSLRRMTEYRWAAQERFGQLDALQYTGPGEDSITLDGVILTIYRGGTGQLNLMRQLAEKGEPQLLVTGLGEIMGFWVIQSVAETQGTFALAGIPRRQEFTMKIRKYDDVAL